MSEVERITSSCGTLLNENITEEECKTLADAFELSKLARGEVLLREGETNDSLYIVIEGELIVTRNAGGDEHVTLHRLRPGEIAGAMGFIDGNSHSATLTAAEDSHVLMLSRENLEEMLYEYPDLVYKVMRMIVRSVHKTLVRMNMQFIEMNNYIMKEHGRY
jgi:CRP/FNR family transcriptional regulator, cyclic AMP receptor protein